MKETNMSAAETNVHFREHDIEFLQKRTKLWLETVLGESYGDRTLPELISDGSLLFRLSKYINKEMTGASPGPQEMSPKTFDRLDSGKYLPYANVDSFLKACRKVGLTDVELFSPSDAVEGKDIRQVCTSIRSLAKKARAQHIRVPDFEDVNRPLPMPKDKVEEIKENLQHSHSSPVSPTVAPPEADIKKSERQVQIISRFLSSTTNPSSGPPSEPSSPATPGPGKPLSTENALLSTPKATIGGIDTPALTKSVSNIEPSPVLTESSKDSLLSSPQSLDEPKLDKAVTTPSPSPALPEDEPSDFPLFSQKALGSFRHAKPHFIIKSSSQSNTPDLAEDPPAAVAAVQPGPEKRNTPEAVSAPSTPAVSTPSKPVDSKPSTPAVPTPSTPVDSNLSKPAVPTPSKPVESEPSKPAVSTPSTPVDSNPSKQAISSDQQADRGKELPTLAQLGLGAYRHAHPHFSFKQSSQADSTDSQDLQPEANPQRTPSGKQKALSSNKIVQKEPRSTMQRTPEGRTSFGPASKGSQGSSAPTKESARKPEGKAPGMDLSPKLWLPLLAGALAFVGTLLLVRPREPIISVYEVKEGDTLSKISKRVGKDSWDELVKLNPGILNPDLIYPSERLKLPTK